VLGAGRAGLPPAGCGRGSCWRVYSGPPTRAHPQTLTLTCCAVVDAPRTWRASALAGHSCGACARGVGNDMQYGRGLEAGFDAAPGAARGAGLGGRGGPWSWSSSASGLALLLPGAAGAGGGSSGLGRKACGIRVW
jgi:hypothetical protein